MKNCALKFYKDLSKEQYNSVYDVNTIANSFFEGTCIYKNYLEAIKSSEYYVFFEEIPLLVSLANIKVDVYCHDGHIYKFEPNQELLGSYKSNHKIWKTEKKEIAIYYEGDHFSRINNSSKQDLSFQSSTPLSQANSSLQQDSLSQSLISPSKVPNIVTDVPHNTKNKSKVTKLALGKKSVTISTNINSVVIELLDKTLELPL